VDSPIKLIIIAAVLLIVGVVLPFLIIIEMLESTIVLNLASFVCSTTGLIMGFIGMGQYVGSRK